MKSINILNQNIDSRYTDLFRQLYGTEDHVDYFIADIRLSIDYCTSTKHITTITLTDGEILLGHCSIISSASSSSMAYFGFFESPENQADFMLLWNSALEEAKRQNIKKLAGPINGSIWFPYRFIATSDSYPLFKGELPAKLSYHQMFSGLKNGQIVAFESGLRRSLDCIIESTKKSCENLENLGLKTEILTKVTNETLKEIQALSESAFSGQSPIYESLPTDYFLKLYNQNRVKDLFGLYLIRKNEALVGFASIFYENKKSVIFKTIAVHPSFQNQGVGSAIAHLVHRDAKEQEIETVIYALVRKGNNVKHFPKDDVVIIRNYSLFVFDI
jgi:GNAT superfamily N-acetyltransferase